MLFLGEQNDPFCASTDYELIMMMAPLCVSGMMQPSGTRDFRSGKQCPTIFRSMTNLFDGSSHIQRNPKHYHYAPLRCDDAFPKDGAAFFEQTFNRILKKQEKQYPSTQNNLAKQTVLDQYWCAPKSHGYSFHASSQGIFRINSAAPVIGSRDSVQTGSFILYDISLDKDQ